MENTMNNTNTSKVSSFFANAKTKVSEVYHNPTVRKAAMITVGTCAVIGGGYLAVKYFGSKAAEVLPQAVETATDVATQVTEVVADAATSV